MIPNSCYLMERFDSYNFYCGNSLFTSYFSNSKPWLFPTSAKILSHKMCFVLWISSKSFVVVLCILQKPWSPSFPCMSSMALLTLVLHCSGLHYLIDFFPYLDIVKEDWRNGCLSQGNLINWLIFDNRTSPSSRWYLSSDTWIKPFDILS